MMQLSYRIAPRDGGWVILLTPGPEQNFPTRQAAFDAAARLAHKLRFLGCSVDIATDGSAVSPTDRRAG